MARSSSQNLLLLSALVCLLAIGCGTEAQTPASNVASDAGTTPVAVVNGVPVTRADLESAAAPQLAKIEEEAYEVRRQQLDDLIADRLIAAEAKRRGVTVDALLAAEVSERTPPVTEHEIDQVIIANRERMPDDPSSVRPRIRAFLQKERTAARRSAFIDELRGKAKVEVLLPLPTAYRASIDVAGAPIRGPRTAPVTVIEYSDFHCPYCRTVQPTLLQLLAKYPTQVRLIYKHFPLDDRHPQARRAAEASWCAGEQNRFWQFHDLVYGAPADASSAALHNLATKAGIDVPAFEACLASGKAAPIVQAQLEEGSHYGVDGTPGFFINGRLISGARPLEAFSKMVDEELASR
jgi:protein-disulfide isomerase